MVSEAFILVMVAALLWDRGDAEQYYSAPGGGEAEREEVSFLIFPSNAGSYWS